MSYTYEIVAIGDNGEFLSWATVVYKQDGVEVGREEFVGTSEEPPGYTGLRLAQSAAESWFESMTTTLEERLAPFGPEWQREQSARLAGNFDPDDLPF